MLNFCYKLEQVFCTTRELKKFELETFLFFNIKFHIFLQDRMAGADGWSFIRF